MPHNKKYVYQAEVLTDKNEPAKYLGVTADDFEARYRNHAKSFTNQKYSTETVTVETCMEIESSKETIFHHMVVA